jgi:hypothetical protein
MFLLQAYLAAEHVADLLREAAAERRARQAALADGDRFGHPMSASRRIPDVRHALALAARERPREDIEMNVTNRSVAEGVSIGAADGLSERPAVTYRLLGSKGFRPDEAGNLTAYLHGLPPVRSAWALREIERLLFLRDLVERGRIGS